MFNSYLGHRNTNPVEQISDEKKDHESNLSAKEALVSIQVQIFNLEKTLKTAQENYDRVSSAWENHEENLRQLTEISTTLKSGLIPQHLLNSMLGMLDVYEDRLLEEKKIEVDLLQDLEEKKKFIDDVTKHLEDSRNIEVVLQEKVENARIAKAMRNFPN